MKKRSVKNFILYLLYIIMVVLIACGCQRKDEKKPEESENETLDNRVSIVEEQLDSIENLLIKMEKDLEEAKNNQNGGAIVKTTPSPGTEGMKDEASSDTDNMGIGQNTSNTTTTNGNLKNQENTNTPTMTIPENAISVTATGIDVDFDSYLAVINALEEDINQTNINGIEAYHTFKMRINEIEEVFDVIDEELESFYQNGKITKSQYASLDSELDVLENKLERIEDNLEERYGIDD